MSDLKNLGKENGGCILYVSGAKVEVKFRFRGTQTFTLDQDLKLTEGISIELNMLSTGSGNKALSTFEVIQAGVGQPLILKHTFN